MIPFVDDYDEALKEAERLRLPLLLYFTSIQDINCRWMDKVLAELLLGKMRNQFLCARLFVDGYPADSRTPKGKELIEQILKLQEKWLNDPVIPSFAIVTSDGQTLLATYFGVESAASAGTFAKFLDDGWARWEQFKTNGRLTERRQDPLR